MLDKQTIDLRNHIEPIHLSVGSDIKINITEGDKELNISFTFDDFDNLIDRYRDQLGEASVNELEDEIISLRNKLENVENYIKCLENKEVFER